MIYIEVISIIIYLLCMFVLNLLLESTKLYTEPSLSYP